MDNRSFRFDINGLRAWAVLTVVLFHFGVPGFGGGYVGVDIFFVISGFLMTGIIVSALEKQNFSLWQFYIARARRIIPALVALCYILILLGWYWLPTVDYRELGIHAVTALAFISNIKFWREAGYFDADSHEKWLLHTWSLSAEWQFYIILPIALLLFWRFWGSRGLLFALLAGFVGSLALSIWLTPQQSSAAYFLLPTRAWQMLAGGLVWWFTIKSPRFDHLQPNHSSSSGNNIVWLERFGFAAVLASTLSFNANTPWPGHLALLPVLGCALILIAGRQHSLLTRNPLAQWLGTRSYSIYLWHWPVCVLLNYLSAQENPIAIMLGLAAALLLGEASYRWIEEPVRKEVGQFRPAWQFAAITGFTASVAVLAISIHHQTIEGRIAPAIETIANEALNHHPDRNRCHAGGSQTTSPSCLYGGEDVAAIVVGDSHADAAMSAVQAALPSPTDGVLGWTYSGCPTMVGAQAKNGTRCFEFNNWVMQEIEQVDQDIPLIIINSLANALADRRVSFPYSETYHSKLTDEAYLALFQDHLVDTACQLAQDRSVYLVRPIPSMPLDGPKVMSRALMFGKPLPDVSLPLATYFEQSKDVWQAQDLAAMQCGVTILDTTAYLCDDSKCKGEMNQRPLYFDSTHISEFGNKLLVPMFSQIFQPVALSSLSEF